MTRIVRWNPWREMELAQREMLRRELNRMARDGGSTTDAERVALLPVDAYETDEALVITASVPGINPDDLNISFEDDVLTIRGAYPNGHQDENARYALRERFSGKFERSLRLNVPVNVNEAEAVFENGILTLTLPKAEEAKPLAIPVKTAR